MGTLATILKIISILGLIGSATNIFQKKDVENSKRAVKVCVFILTMAFIIGWAGGSPEIKNTNGNISNQHENISKQTDKDQLASYQEWINSLKIPIGKYEENVNKYILLTANAQSGKIPKSKIISSMKELEVSFQDEVNFEFRNVASPNKKLFTEEQNRKIWYIQSYFADAANNYSSAAYYTGEGIKNNNTDQVKLSEESIYKANSYIRKAIENLKSLQKEIGVTPDSSDDIKINLN